MSRLRARIDGLVWLHRADLGPAQVEELKRELTLRPTVSSFAFGVKEPIAVYKEDGDWLGLPRHFAWQRFPDAVRGAQDQASFGMPVKFKFQGELWVPQRTFVDNLMNSLYLKAPYRGVIGQAPCGCHAAGEMILMADGSRKAAENIVVGDRLMGIDGPRCVRELHRGRQRMARIVPHKGEPFIVNVGHVLTLLWSVSDGAHKDGDVIDISVGDWLASSKNFQRHTVLYRPAVHEFETDYTSEHRPIRPYHLGMLLGDGSLLDSVGVTKPDPEIAVACGELAQDFGLQLRTETSGGTCCPTHYLVGDQAQNPLKDALKRLGLCLTTPSTRFVPRQYLVASRQDRMGLLAGLLDMNGRPTRGGYDWISKSQQLADDVVFLCRSVGLAAYLRPCRKEDQHADDGVHYCVSISGGCANLPVRIPHRMAPAWRSAKDVQWVKFSVKLLSEDDYYGFTVDADGRYLLGDFTWTHNSGKTTVALYVTAKVGRTTLVLVHQEFLMDQWIERAKQFLGLKDEEIGRVQRDTCQFHDRKFVVAMIQSLMTDHTKYPAALLRWPGLVITDEVHRMGAPVFSRTVDLFPALLRLGLSATPNRGDGLDNVFFWHIGDVGARIKQYQLKPKVFRVSYPTFIDERMIRVLGRELALGRLITLLSKVRHRTAYIAEQAVKAAKAHRKVLILSDRREQLNELNQMIRDAGVSSVGYYVGGMTRQGRNKSAGKRILLGTYQLAREGLDIPELDTLILATPKADVEQAVGRILRMGPNKRAPLVVDIVDTASVCQAFGGKRMKMYRKHEFEVVDVALKAVTSVPVD